MVQVINIAPALEPILGFLHPTYSYTDGITKFREFITHHDVQSTHEREMLDHLHEDAVVISTRVFDTLYTPEIMADEVVAFARRHFKSKKRVLKLQSTTPELMVRECLDFLFLEAQTSDAVAIEDLFRSYGSKAFLNTFTRACALSGHWRVIASMETFIQKVLMDTQTVYYLRARQRLLTSLQQNLEAAVAEMRTIDPYFRKRHPDLVALRLYTLLMKKEYYR